MRRLDGSVVCEEVDQEYSSKEAGVILLKWKLYDMTESGVYQHALIESASAVCMRQ